MDDNIFNMLLSQMNLLLRSPFDPSEPQTAKVEHTTRTGRELRDERRPELCKLPRL